MKLLTPLEASQWRASHAITTFERGKNQRDSHPYALQCKNPQHGGKYFWFARVIEKACRPWQQCLLSVEEWGIWESSENWNLYYSLCGRFDEVRRIEEDRALLFPQSERDVLITFVQVGLSMGWDLSLVTTDDKCRVFVSHDEWTRFSMRLKTEYDLVRQDFEQYNLIISE